MKACYATDCVARLSEGRGQFQNWFDARKRRNSIRDRGALIVVRTSRLIILSGRSGDRTIERSSPRAGQRSRDRKGTQPKFRRGGRANDQKHFLSFAISLLRRQGQGECVCARVCARGRACIQRRFRRIWYSQGQRFFGQDCPGHESIGCIGGHTQNPECSNLETIESKASRLVAATSRSQKGAIDVETYSSVAF